MLRHAALMSAVGYAGAALRTIYALPCDVVTERGLVRPFGSPEQESRLVV